MKVLGLSDSRGQKSLPDPSVVTNPAPWFIPEVDNRKELENLWEDSEVSVLPSRTQPTIYGPAVLSPNITELQRKFEVK